MAEVSKDSYQHIPAHLEQSESNLFLPHPVNSRSISWIKYRRVQNTETYVKKCVYLAVRMKLPEFDIIHEGHVVRRMPVQAVAMEVKRDGVNQSVNGLHDLKYNMLSPHVFFPNCK